MTNIEQAVKDYKRMKTTRKPERPHTTSIKAGTLADQTRATFIVKEDLLQRIKQIASEQGKQIKDIVNESFNLIIEQYDNE